jgi:hypothetical protein
VKATKVQNLENRSTIFPVYTLVIIFGSKDELIKQKEREFKKSGLYWFEYKKTMYKNVSILDFF